MEAARAVASAILRCFLPVAYQAVAFGQLYNWPIGRRCTVSMRCSPCCRRRRNAKGTREYSSYTSLTRDGAFVVSALSSRGRPLWTSRLANAVLSHGIIALFACSRCSPASNHYSTPVLRAVAPCARWSRAQRARWLDSCLAARRIDAEASAGLNYRVASTARLT